MAGSGAAGHRALAVVPAARCPHHSAGSVGTARTVAAPDSGTLTRFWPGLARGSVRATQRSGPPPPAGIAGRDGGEGAHRDV
jgi:hypothetical protein